MELTNQIILLGALLMSVSILASIISSRLGVPILLVFLCLGMLAGEQGLGGIAYSDIQSAHLIGSLALAIILFDGGIRTHVDSFRVALWPALSLATVGVVITATLTGVAATWLLNLHWLEGLLIGAIVGSTDAAAVFGLLHAHGMELKQRTGATLEIESGSNDPMAIFLTIALVEVLAAGATTLDAGIVQTFAQQMGIGLVAGWLGGLALAWVINHVVLSPGLYPLLALAGGVLLFAFTGVLGGSGFLAIYLAGLVIGNRPLQSLRNIRRFHDGMAWLSQIGMFLMLGLLATPSQLLQVALPGLALAAVLILVARPVAVAVSLLPFRFPIREQVYIGWVGLRGAVPIILALFPFLDGLPNAPLYFNMAFFVVLVSLVLQGSTVASMARWLNLEIPPKVERVRRLELDLPGQPDHELVVYQLQPHSPVIGREPATLLLPGSAEFAGLIRGGHPVPQPGRTTMQADDYLLILAHPKDIPLLDAVLVPSERRPELEDMRFFGEFVLAGDARLADVASVYGFRLAPEWQEHSLEQFLSERFNARPVVGDRAMLGEVELVVREMDGARIVRVGLKLPH